jgi:uncharacterized protein (DUF169 family)
MDLIRIGEALQTYVRPQTHPVAVGMVGRVDDIPEKARMPKRDAGRTMALCQGLTLARRHGWLVAMGLDDMLCPLGALTVGFVAAKEKFLDGSFAIPFWVKDQSVRSRMAKAIPQLEVGKYTHVLLAPLQRAEFEPDVIIVYGDPAQIARLIQAAAYETGEPVTSVSVGGFACGGEITMPMLTGACQYIMTGGGDRAIAQTQDHEAAFAMPAAKAISIAEGLAETHKAGMRYPTPALLPFGAGLPPSFDELMEYLKQGK